MRRREAASPSSWTLPGLWQHSFQHSIPQPSCPACLTVPQVIGATSSLTYNVVGHVKTVLILSGGVMFFGDTMPPKKMAGIMAAMGGIIW